MSNAGHPRSRTTDLIRITREYFEDTGKSELSFSRMLWTNYLAMVPDSQRQLKIYPSGGSHEGAGEEVKENQYKRYLRYMDRTTHLPIEVEESWVEALEEPYRTRAVQQLCSRYDVVAVDQKLISDTKRASLCLEEFSRFLEQAGKMLADGRIDQNDLPHLESLENTGSALLSQVHSLINVARVKTAEKPSDETYPKVVGLDE